MMYDFRVGPKELDIRLQTSSDVVGRRIKQAPKGFRPPSAMKGIGYFQNLRNFLRIYFWKFFGFFGNVLGGFFGGIFLEDFFEGILLEK